MRLSAVLNSSLDVSGASGWTQPVTPPQKLSFASRQSTYRNSHQILRQFGYERELQPTNLENRCFVFFGAPPEGWHVDHALFSSGQAAMAATLHLVETLPVLFSRKPLRLAHIGAYYETGECLRLFPSISHTSGSEVRPADIVLIEPVFFKRAFHEVDVMQLRSKFESASPVLIFDDTLTGAALDPSGDLQALSNLDPLAVLRVASGLKLLQGGLELANVGIVSLYTRDADEELASRIRKIRSVLGLGLRLSELAALEAPWFLNRDYADSYRRAVFEHNAALAQAVAGASNIFSSVSHPSLDCRRGVAPFCVFRLRDESADAYERLAAKLADISKRRQILFERGGSFGFRGHRFDVVNPEKEPPFLRVAMGRRDGWSCEEIMKMFKAIAS